MIQVLVLPNGTQWIWIENSVFSDAPPGALIGGYSQEGRPIYVVKVRKPDASHIAGCHQEGRTTAEYVLHGCETSADWKYLVIMNGKLIN